METALFDAKQSSFQLKLTVGPVRAVQQNKSYISWNM